MSVMLPLKSARPPNVTDARVRAVTPRRTVKPSLAPVPLLDVECHASLARPFLRWAGGKSKLLGAILPFIPDRFDNYHEPFLGSGAVFFAVRERSSGNAYLSDLNGELTNLWSVVRDRPADLAAALACYVGRDTEEDYYLIRALRVSDPVERAAWFFYLNQTAWNGLWRVNRWGVFNVPWGARVFRGLDASALLAATDALAATEIRNSDFRETLASARRGDFVYLDPPYLPISDTSKFAGYTERRFRKADLAELADLCRDLTGRGVTWVMSNRDTPSVRELFAHARIVPFTTWRAVSAQNKRNVEPSASLEVLVVGGERG